MKGSYKSLRAKKDRRPGPAIQQHAAASNSFLAALEEQRRRHARLEQESSDAISTGSASTPGIPAGAVVFDGSRVFRRTKHIPSEVADRVTAQCRQGEAAGAASLPLQTRLSFLRVLQRRATGAFAAGAVPGACAASAVTHWVPHRVPTVSCSAADVSLDYQAESGSLMVSSSSGMCRLYALRKTSGDSSCHFSPLSVTVAAPNLSSFSLCSYAPQSSLNMLAAATSLGDGGTPGQVELFSFSPEAAGSHAEPYTRLCALRLPEGSAWTAAWKPRRAAASDAELFIGASPGQSFLARVRPDGSILALATATGALSDIFCACFPEESSCDAGALLGQRNGDVLVWDVRAGGASAARRSFAVSGGSVVALLAMGALSPWGVVVADAADGLEVRDTRCLAGPPLRRLRGYTNDQKRRGVAVWPGSLCLVAAACADGFVRCWDAHTSSLLAANPPRVDQIVGSASESAAAASKRLLSAKQVVFIAPPSRSQRQCGPGPLLPSLGVLRTALPEMELLSCRADPGAPAAGPVPQVS